MFSRERTPDSNQLMDASAAIWPCVVSARGVSGCVIPPPCLEDSSELLVLTTEMGPGSGAGLCEVVSCPTEQEPDAR